MEAVFFPAVCFLLVFFTALLGLGFCFASFVIPLVFAYTCLLKVDMPILTCIFFTFN